MPDLWRRLKKHGFIKWCLVIFFIADFQEVQSGAGRQRDSKH
nr:MAG TPA: hypothetical protein [Caudoviricetes sp.]